MPFGLLRKPRSLVGRLLCDAVAALAVVVLGMGAITLALSTGQHPPALWEGLQAHVRGIQDGLQVGQEGRLLGVSLSTSAADSYDGLTKDTAYEVLDANGHELFASPSGPALAALREIPVQASSDIIPVHAGDVELAVYTERVKKGASSYFIRVASSRRLASVVRSTGGAIFFGTALLTTLLALLVFCWFVLRTTRQLARPLQEVSAAASAIGASNLSARLGSTQLPAELDPLIRSFNGALDRLETGYSVQQEFLASAAHELKTPLALIRAEIESMDLPHRANLLGDVDLMARQVHQLLHLAEASETHNYVFEAVDIEAAVADATGFTRRVAERKGVQLRVRADGMPPTPTRADRGALFILLKNLLENAVQHSEPGQAVTVAVDANGLEVSDQGPGVAAGEVPKLFNRFWRSARSRHAGAGLGLAICRQITEAHGWQLRYTGQADMPGASFRIDFS